MVEQMDIMPHEIVKVLVDNEGIEEDLYAKVVSNEGTHLYVSYLMDTSRVYKGACVYQFERHVNMVGFESIMEHHQGVIDIEDIGLKKININMFVYSHEIDDTDSNENAEDMSDDEDGDSDDSFVVPDEPAADLPPDHQKVDEEWDRWCPATAGAGHFKNVVDSLDEKYRYERDDKFF